MKRILDLIDGATRSSVCPMGGSLESSITMISETRSSMRTIDARHRRSDPARFRVTIPTDSRHLASMDMVSGRDGLLIDLERALGGAGPRHAPHLLEGG